MTGNRVLVWHPPDGEPLLFSDIPNGIGTQWEQTGFLRPTYRMVTRRYPGRPGAKLRSVEVNERQLEVGLVVWGNTRTEYLSRVRSVSRRLRPGAGLGRLEVHEPDGSVRWIEAVCSEGLEGADGPGAGGREHGRFSLSFLAPDPFARTAAITESWTLTSTGRGWFPLIPIALGASGVGGRRTIHNPGDVETFPVITVHGPGTDLVAANRTSGKSAHLNYSIPDTGLESVVTIDTRRGSQKIVDGYGNNLFEFVTDEDPSLWSLLPGDNEVEIRLGQTGANSQVSVTFEPLYESL